MASWEEFHLFAVLSCVLPAQEVIVSLTRREKQEEETALCFNVEQQKKKRCERWAVRTFFGCGWGSAGQSGGGPCLNPQFCTDPWSPANQVPLWGPP
jgi:hypothetical protein